jgi:AAA+ ATPase superfamily predicted ATPase
VPILQYIALSAEQKDHLERFDIIMIAIMVMIISFSFLLVLNISFGVALFLFISATLGLMIITCMTFNNYITARNQSKSVIIRTSNFFKERQKQRRAILLCALTAIQWYYPIIYILAIAKVLDHNYTIACFALGSMFGKVLLSTLEVETHISMLYEFLLTSPNSNLGETSSSRVLTVRTQDETSFTMKEFSNKYLTSIGSFNSFLKPLSMKYSMPNLFLGTTTAKIHVEAHQSFHEEGEKEKQDHDGSGDNDEDFIVIDEDDDLIPELTQQVDELTRTEIVVLV